MPVDVDRRGKARLHSLHDRTDRTRIEIVDQKGELVATEARGDVGRAQSATQPLPHLSQKAITRQMTERIVDQLEPVEVEKHDRVTKRRWRTGIA